MSRYPMRPLGAVISPATSSVAVDPDGKYPLAGIYSFGRGLISRPEIRGFETAYKRLTPLKAGQLVMSKLNAWEGAIALVPSEFNGSHVSPEYPVFDIDSVEADPTYIGYLVTWPEIWERLAPRGSMARRKRTTPQTVMDLEVPLPSLDEQLRIAAHLNFSFSKFDRIRNLRSHSHKLSSAIKESLIANSLAGSVTQFSVDDIIKLQRRPVDVVDSAVYREIGLRSFGKGIFHKEPVAGWELDGKRVFWIEPDDLIFSNVFAWEGAVGVASRAEKGMIGSHRFMTYQVESEVADLRYLLSYFTSSVGLEMIRRSSPGSAGRNKTLGIKSFSQQAMALPSLAIQKKVAWILDGVRAAATRSSIADEYVNALRTSLLNTAFNGML